MIITCTKYSMRDLISFVASFTCMTREIEKDHKVQLMALCHHAVLESNEIHCYTIIYMKIHVNIPSNLIFIFFSGYRVIFYNIIIIIINICNVA